MPFGTLELIHSDTIYQPEHDSLVLAMVEAQGQGGTAFSLFGELSLDGGTTFTPVAVASVSDFAPPLFGGRRQSLSMPVPAGTKFRLRVDATGSADIIIRAWVMRVS